MRRIVYSVAMSLDGYLAGPDGEADWIAIDPELDFAEAMARFDTILMGRRTYEAGQAMGGGPPMPGITTVVVSRTLRQQDHPDLRILAEDLAEEVSRLRQAPGKDIWLFGGGTLFRSLLALGLVDAVEVAVIPVLLGQGIPLLPEIRERTTLRLARSRVYETTGTVVLAYEVAGSDPT